MQRKGVSQASIFITIDMIILPNLDCDCDKEIALCNDGEWWQKCEKCDEENKLGGCRGNI